MSEPDEETVRRWKEYTRPPEARSGPDRRTDPPAVGRSGESSAMPPLVESGRRDRHPPTSDRGSRVGVTGTFSARRMAILGTALFVALGLIAILITWPPGVSGGGGLSAGPRPAQPGDIPKGSEPRNLVVLPGDSRELPGTVISGVSWTDGHEPEKMIDGHPGTSWSATGTMVTRRIRFELGEKHLITRVAITLPDTETRAITKVTWIFPDTPVTSAQVLRAGDSGPQVLDVGPATTNVVVLTLDVVGPAPLPTADFTGISEVQIFGY